MSSPRARAIAAELQAADVDRARGDAVDGPRGAAGAERELSWLTRVFLLSGAAAIVYQVAWERVLYSIFGINTESVTLIVTAFLLGLGVGSIVGGWISKRPGCRHLQWFAAAELSIAAFGSVSVPFYHAVGRATLGLGAFETGVVTFVLILAPTMLMGATLPLLADYAVAKTGSVGWSVATLYHVNTAGSAMAAIAAVTLLLPFAGLRGSVWVAAACNALVALTALRRAAAPARAPAGAP